MSDYERSTRRCGFVQLRAELQQGFRDYFMAHELADLDETSLVCCETVSRKKEAGGLFGWLAGVEKADALVYTAIVLGPEILLWARVGEPYTPTVHVTRANFQEIRVKLFHSLASPDTGLEVSGLIEGAKGVMRGYIGLGPEEDARKFCEEVIQAVEKVNPRPKGMWPGWMGGR